MRRLRTAVLVAAMTIIFGNQAMGARGKRVEREPEVDHLALASMMVKDGHYDRAAAVLMEVIPQEQGEDFDVARYHMLLGLVQLKQGEYGAAKNSFEAALRNGHDEPVAHVFLAQALFGLGKYEATVQELDRAKEAADALPGTFMLRAQCHYKLEDRPSAYKDLERGRRIYPDDLEMRRYGVLLLVDMGLFQQAVIEGTEYLGRDKVEADDYATICEALIRGGDPGSAILLLEEARLRYPDNVEVTLQLARAYLKVERPLTAARLFNSVSRQDGGMALDTAELYRRAGRLTTALAMNADVVDQEAKIRQRLGILIELGRYEEAAALEPRLDRLGLLVEDAVRYALAFSLFKTSRFKRAEKHLGLIRDPGMFEKTLELRRAMDRCRAAGWECR